jgi:hypothetical protein
VIAVLDASHFNVIDARLFREKINSDYNNFVARVALEVVDGSWWKQQVRVKSAGSGATALSSSNKGHRRSRYSPSVTALTANT